MKYPVSHYCLMFKNRAKSCQPCKIHENISKEKLTMVLTLSLNAFD
jgi:hypothetical protein